MPHNWAGAEFIRLTVHLLALDRGTEMHLLEGIPREWLGKGKTTSVKDIATPFGKLSLTLQVDKKGKTAKLDVDKLSKSICTGLFVHLGDWGECNGKTSLQLDADKQNSIIIHLK